MSDLKKCYLTFSNKRTPQRNLYYNVDKPGLETKKFFSEEIQRIGSNTPGHNQICLQIRSYLGVM